MAKKNKSVKKISKKENNRSFIKRFTKGVSKRPKTVRPEGLGYY